MSVTQGLISLNGALLLALESETGLSMQEILEHYGKQGYTKRETPFEE